MTMSELRKLYRAEPFRPFVLHMLEGATIEVPGRESMRIIPGAKSTFFVFARDFIWVRDVQGIVSMEFKKPTRRRTQKAKRRIGGRAPARRV